MSAPEKRADKTPLVDSKRPRPGQSKISGRLALVTISVALALVVGEILCRFMAAAPLPMRFRQDVDQLHGFRMHQFAQIIQADPELFWRLGPNCRLPDDAWPFPGVISNGQGFREDHEISPRKPAGTIRVLFVGDSCTFGFGLKYTEGIVKRVEAELGKKVPGMTVECINAGVPGYSLFQGWRLLETKGFDFEPDLIVLCFGWNDADQWDGRSDLEHYAAMQASRPPAALQWSQLCKRLWSVAYPDGGASSKSTKRDRLSPTEFRSLLEKIQHAAAARGIDVLLLTWPMRANIQSHVPPGSRTPLQMETQVFELQERQAGAAHFVGRVDLVPVAQALGQRHQDSDIFFDAGHGTALANQEFTRTIVAALEPWIRAREQTR